jgi:hypothetical protein
MLTPTLKRSYNVHWFDCKTYWRMLGTPEPGKPYPPPPTKKRLDYVTLHEGKPCQMQLCIGVWDDDKYTELHRDELAFHQRSYK